MSDSGVTALKTEGGPKRARLEPIPFKDIKVSTTSNYLIKGFVPDAALTVLWGAPKSGKSFLAFDMAMAIARESAWRGRRVRGGPVVYLAAEGATGFRARVEAYRQRHFSEEQVSEDQEDPPFYLVADMLGLPTDLNDLIRAIFNTLKDEGPVLVVLDTLNRTLEGSENAPEDMTAYIRACDAIRNTFGCAVLVVHHCGTEGNRPRGHTSLTGAADCQIAVKGASNGVISAEIECMKDGPQGETHYSRLEVLTVGKDEDGDDITSCVVVEAEKPSEGAATGAELNKNQETMFGILYDAGSAGMTQAAWNAEAREAGLGVKRKADLYDCRKRLVRLCLVYEQGGRWFAKRRVS